MASTTLWQPSQSHSSATGPLCYLWINDIQNSKIFQAKSSQIRTEVRLLLQVEGIHVSSLRGCTYKGFVATLGITVQRMSPKYR